MSACFITPTYIGHGTGDRHRGRRWPTSLLTDKQVKLVIQTQHPDKKVSFFLIFKTPELNSMCVPTLSLFRQNVLIIGDQHLRPMVDNFVSMPDGPLSYSFLAVSGAKASELRAEVLHAAIPFTPDIVCVLATGNILQCKGTIADMAKDFAALLVHICNRWEKV